MLLEEGCTYPRPHVTKGTNFYAVASNICGSAVWKLLYFTLLAPRFLENLWSFVQESGQHSNTFECIYLANKCSNTSRAGASSPGLLCVQRTLIQIHSQYVFINAPFNCAVKVLSPCHSVMLSLNFGAPALEELPVLHFLSTPSTRHLKGTQPCSERRDCSRRYWKAFCLSQTVWFEQQWEPK